VNDDAMSAAQSAETSIQNADVVAYPPAWRIAAAALTVIARGSLLVTAAAILLADEPPTNPLKQMRLFGGLFAAPELAAWCIARAFAARASVSEGSLVLTLRDRRVEVPLEAIAAVEPWSLALPRGGGLWLRLRSGRRLQRALGVADLVGLVNALVAAGVSPGVRTALAHPMAVFTRARLANPRSRLDHPVFKFVLCSLIATLPVFRLHQYITYGGTFGEYYTFGLKAYLQGFGLWWASWSLGFLYVAAAARAVVEIVALAAAAATPSYAIGVRRGLEIAQRLMFYAGIPTWLALRLTG